MKEIVKEYSNGEITVVWKPNTCIHSGICFRGLPNVFDPRKRPWTNIEGASTHEIVEQVNKCPSGALSYFRNNAEIKENVPGNTIEVSNDGPLLIHGNFKLMSNGREEYVQNTTTALCRCGSSGNKPFCDGSHLRISFKG